MVVFTIEEPIRDVCRLSIAHLTEETKRGLVALVDIDIELMQVEDTTGVVVNLLERGGGISLPTVVIEDDKTELSPTIGRIEADEVDDTDGLSLGVVNHHPNLTIGIDIIGDMGHIIVEHITGIGHVRSSDVPKADVVLDAIEQVEILGFDSPEVYGR